MYYSRNYFLVDQGRRRRRFGTTVKASPQTINDIVKARNLGEVDEPCGTVPTRRPPAGRTLADLIEADGFAVPALHMACFVGFLALKTQVASVEDVLGDVGLIHEIAHNMHFGEGEASIASRSEVVRMARQIERAIPGYPYR